MPAIIIIPDATEKMIHLVETHFDDYLLVTITSKDKTNYYVETRKAIATVYQMLTRSKKTSDFYKSDIKVFFIANGNPAFNALLAGKLARVTKFMLAEWIEDEQRFRVLRVP